MIAVALDREEVEVGEFLTGKVHWSGDPNRSAARLIVAVEWSTDGKGNRARGIARVAQFPVKKGQTAGTFPFRLLIPHEGPVSFAGELISVSWTLRARIDQPGLDELLQSEFRVTPMAR